MAAERNLLIVDGDAVAAGALAEQLSLGGEFAVRIAASCRAALASAAESTPDLVLTAARLPDATAAEFVAELRAREVVEPVLILVGPDGDSDAAAAVDAGADDRESLPIRISALIGRVRSHLTRHEAGQDAVIALGPYAFRPGAKLLTVEDRKIRLTEKETAILRYLHRVAAPVARDVLLSEVWGYTSGVTTHTLETHIYRLRQKIELDPAAASILVTDPAGYRLMA